MSSKLILIILSYTVSKSVRFLRHSVDRSDLLILKATITDIGISDITQHLSEGTMHPVYCITEGSPEHGAGMIQIRAFN